MTNRLTAFVAALLLLPPLGLFLSGQEWEAPKPITGDEFLPTLVGTFVVLAFGILLDAYTFHRTRSSLLRSQRSYLLWCAVAGALTCTLLAYLNLFADAWFTPAGSQTQALLLAALCGIALLPTVLIVRLWIAGLPGLVRLSARKLAVPALPTAAAAMLPLVAALTGLLAGPAWVHYLGWLFWLSPLLLLVALQILWDESTVFAGLPQGDWSRVLLGAAAGIVACSIALAAYRLSGGKIYFAISTWQLIAGFAMFGILCLQIADIVAENWRGRPRGEVFKKKPFPIPIITKKDK